MLDELLTVRASPISFRLIATDHAEAELAAARRGVYDEAAVRHVRLRHLRDYFRREGEAYVIAPRLRARVDFSAYDLLDEQLASPPAGIFGDFDLTLCCNLLFYYRPDRRRLILDRLQRSLSPHGYLVTGETERALVERSGGFHAVASPVAVFQPLARSPLPPGS